MGWRRAAGSGGSGGGGGKFGGTEFTLKTEHITGPNNNDMSHEEPGTLGERASGEGDDGRRRVGQRSARNTNQV